MTREFWPAYAAAVRWDAAEVAAGRSRDSRPEDDSEAQPVEHEEPGVREVYEETLCGPRLTPAIKLKRRGGGDR